MQRTNIHTVSLTVSYLFLALHSDNENGQIKQGYDKHRHKRRIIGEPIGQACKGNDVVGWQQISVNEGGGFLSSSGVSGIPEAQGKITAYQLASQSDGTGSDRLSSDLGTGWIGQLLIPGPGPGESRYGFNNVLTVAQLVEHEVIIEYSQLPQGH